MGRPKTTRSLASRLAGLARYLWPWIRTERRAIGVSMLALIAGVILRLAEPWPLKFVLDLVLSTDGLSRGADTLRVAALASGSLVAITALRAYCDFHQRLGFARTGNRVLRRLRTHAYDHVHTLSLAFHTRSRVGDLLTRLTRDVTLLRDAVSTALLPLFGSWLVLVAMLVVVMVMEWRLALLTTATIPVLLFFATRLGTSIHTAASKQRRREGQMAATAAESIQSMREVQALAVESRFTERFAGKNLAGAKEDLKAARLSAGLVRTVDLVGAVGMAAVLWYGTSLVVRGTMTAGDLVIFLTYLKRAMKPIKDFAKHSARLAKATAAGERVMAVLQVDPDVTDAPDAVIAPRLSGAIEFEGVEFRYGEGGPIFEDFSLRIEAGECFMLMGESGAGKSTLVQLLLRLHDPVAGAIRVDGTDIREYTLSSYRPQIATVFQDAVLFSGTILDNIAFGNDEAHPERVERAARAAGAHRFVSALPDGYDTLVGERGTTLSLGQRQRIAIARALFRETKILALDEPTSGLDEHNAQALIRTLSELPDEVTTIVTTHDPRLADRADRVAVIEGRRVTEIGRPEELRRASGAYASLWNVFSRTAQ